MTANSFDWDDELPPETEEEVYGALLRALRRKQGFGLFFVQCTPDQGKKIVADLCQDLPQQKIQELHLQGEVVTLYDQIAELWHKQPFDVLVVEGLQASLYAYEDTKRFSGWSSSDIYNYSWKGVPKILNHLNQQREHLRNDFPVRFVFLVPDFVVDYFIQRAADFLDWRSGLFRFPRDPKDFERFIGGNFTKYLTLAPQERIEKILEVKSLQEICSDLESKPRLLSELGMLFAAEQDYGNAIASWEKVLEIKPDDYLVWFIHGKTLSALGRKEEAITSYDKTLEIKPDFQAAWYARGSALFVLGRKEEAITNYDKALEIKPDDYEAWYARSLVLSVLGRYEEAITSYDKALEIKLDDYEVWYMRGSALFVLGRYEEAITSYDKALEIKPDDYEAWDMRSLVLSTSRHYEEAITSYDKALEIKPDDHEAWYMRGLVLSALGRYEEAITSYDKALEIKPDDYEALCMSGSILSALGRYEEAITSYDKALEISPDNYKIWYKKACCYSVQKKINLAIDTLQHAITLNPQCREMAKTDSDFDGIRQDDRFQALIGE